MKYLIYRLLTICALVFIGCGGVEGEYMKATNAEFTGTTWVSSNYDGSILLSFTETTVTVDRPDSLVSPFFYSGTYRSGKDGSKILYVVKGEAKTLVEIDGDTLKAEYVVFQRQ